MSAAAGETDPRGYLASLELHGIKLGLSTIRAICAALGHPERRFRSVLIAGTNGKGSVAAMAAAALRAAGHRTGRYTSPHLVHLEERFVIDDASVPPQALDAAITAVRRAVSRLQDEGVIDVHPTFFEVTTAAAFVLFVEARLDVAVLEVGLGGRFDATNVADPAVVAITSIALDHEAYLGDTLEKIAFEKAGVVRRGVPVVTGGLSAEALGVVQAVCTQRDAPLVPAMDGCSLTAGRVGGLTRLTLDTPVRRYGPLTLALRGHHQVENAVVAVRLLEALDRAGVPCDASAVAAGLETARWPARLSVYELPDGKRLVVDGAHNPAGAEALAAYLRDEWPAGLPIVFGAMRDKRISGMVAALGGTARPLVVTRAPGRRGADPAHLADEARAAGVEGVVAVADVDAALAHAWALGPTIVVAGSLYLAGRVLDRLGLL